MGPVLVERGGGAATATVEVREDGRFQGLVTAAGRALAPDQALRLALG